MSRLSLPRWVWVCFVALVALSFLFVIFRLGSQASAGVSLNDPVVWVEDGAKGRLLQINGSTGEVTASVDVGEDGDSIVAFPRGLDAVFLNRTTGEIGVVGAISLDVDVRNDLVNQDLPFIGEQLEMYANYETDDWDAYIVDSDRLQVYEPGGRARLTINAGSSQLQGVVVSHDGALLAVTGDGTQVGITNEQGLVTLIGPLEPLEGPNAQPPSLVRAGESVYLVDPSRRVVNEVLIEDQELGPNVSICGSLGPVQVGGNVLTTSDGSHRILAHDGAAGILSVSDPDRSDCVQINLDISGPDWGPPVAVDDTAYLSNYETGQIVVVDLVDRVVLKTYNFSGRRIPFELEVFDGAVWANEPQGFRAAIISKDEIREVLKLAKFVFGGEEAGDGDTPIGAAGDEADTNIRAFGDDAEPVDFGPNADQVGGGEDVAVESNGEPDSAEDAGGEDNSVADIASEAPVDLPDAPIILPSVDDPAAELLDELIANFVFSTDTLNVGEEVRLSDESSGTPISWNWSFGDGTSASGPDVAKTWEEEGLFTVTLFVTNDAGDEAQQTHDFTVVAVDQLRVPTAFFDFRSETIEVGEEIVFTDASTGEPDTLIWDFGDGSTDVGPQVSHTYSAPGVYEVALTASNAAGPNTTSALITVVEGVKAPEAIIGAFPGIIEVDQSITLVSESTNSPTAVSWGFGDGTTALGSTVRHSWERPGTYQIRLSVSNSAGSGEQFAEIKVEPRVNPPVARFDQSQLQIVQGESINFSDLSLNSPSSLSWEFGDGSTAQGSNVSHSWDEPGSFTVTLTAKNEAGLDSVSKTITVIPLPPDPPTASFTIPSATVPVNSVVRFTDTSTGDPTEWLWTFGDGTSTRAQSPPHGYGAEGTYEVTLTASNAGGSTSVTKTIVVIDPPVASFTRVVDELTVDFTDTSLNSPESFKWDFGDGSKSTAQNPQYEYDEAGTYTVTLVVTNEAGTSSPFEAAVTVVRSPVAAFGVTKAGLTADFADQSTDNPNVWAWNFGDGVTSSSASPIHTYATSGSYTATLTVSNSAGSDSRSTVVTVTLAPPEAAFSCSVVGGGVACDGGASTSASSFLWSAPGSIAQSGTTTENATFTYPSTGSYDITLTVKNTEGTPDSTTQTVSVVVPEPPTITNLSTTSNDNGVVGLSASASNSPTSWSWTTTGGGSVANGTTSTPTITFTTDGTKTITAVATNAVGDSAPRSIDVVVTLDAPPVINSISVDSNANGVVSVSADVTNTPVTYAWSAPGASPATSSSPAPTFTYSANGPHTISLTVTNADGNDSRSRAVTVSGVPQPPVISNVSVSGESPAGTVTLTGTASNSPTGWTWSIDGQNSNAASPTFTFPANGTYNGSVIASNGAGVSDPFPFSVTISGYPPPPVADFTFIATPGVTAVPFSFSGSAQGGATYTWSFGQTGPNVVHDFGAVGTYSVTLTVTDAGGTDTATKTVVIDP